MMDVFRSFANGNITVFIYAAGFAMCLIGVILWGGTKKRSVSMQKGWNFSALLPSRFRGELDGKSSTDNILGDCSYYISRGKYNLLTVSVSVGISLLGLLFGSIMLILLGILFFAISRPVETYLSFKLPFYKFANLFRKMEMRKKEDEILESMGILRNMLLLQRESPLGADIIIDQLMQMSELIRPAFQKLLIAFRVNNYKAAYDGFVSEVDTDLGKEYAQLLTTLDESNPKDLDAILESYQRHASEVR